MQDHPSPDPVERATRAQEALLFLLLAEKEHPLWSVEEVACELGDASEAKNAIDRLEAEGLLHRLGGFVFATRPARCFEAYSG